MTTTKPVAGSPPDAKPSELLKDSLESWMKERFPYHYWMETIWLGYVREAYEAGYNALPRPAEPCSHCAGVEGELRTIRFMAQTLLDANKRNANTKVLVDLVTYVDLMLSRPTPTTDTGSAKYGGFHLCGKCHKPVTNGEQCKRCDTGSVLVSKDGLERDRLKHRTQGGAIVVAFVLNQGCHVNDDDLLIQCHYNNLKYLEECEVDEIDLAPIRRVIQAGQEGEG